MKYKRGGLQPERNIRRKRKSTKMILFVRRFCLSQDSTPFRKNGRHPIVVGMSSDLMSRATTEFATMIILISFESWRRRKREEEKGVTLSYKLSIYNNNVVDGRFFIFQESELLQTGHRTRPSPFQ